MTNANGDTLGAPKVVDRATFQAALDAVRIREKAHTRAGDAIAAARRRLPMVAVDGRHSAYWRARKGYAAGRVRGPTAAHCLLLHVARREPAPDQCEGCTWDTSQVRELSYVHSRDVTFAGCARAHSTRASGIATSWDGSCPGIRRRFSDTRLVGRRVGLMHLVCYLRQGSDVFETYWTWMRGVEAMDNNYRLLDLTVYGRQECGRTCHLAGRNSGRGEAGDSSRWTPNRRNGLRVKAGIPTTGV